MRTFLHGVACGALLLLLAGCSSAEPEPPYKPTETDKRDYAVAQMNEFTRLSTGGSLTSSQEAQLRGWSLDEPTMVELINVGLEACTELREDSIRSLAAEVDNVRGSADTLRTLRDAAGAEWEDLDLITDPLDRLDRASEYLCPDLRNRFFEVESAVG